VWPLVVTIALNLMRDEARRNIEREILGAVPDIPTNHDVEIEGLARIELERVQQAMAQLSPSHRDVLMNEITPHDEVPKTARNATKMMRLRARRALTTLLETAVLRAGLMGLKVRQTLGMNDPFLPIRMSGGEGVAAPAAALALATLLFGSVAVQPAPVANASEPTQPSVTSPAFVAGYDGVSATSNSNGTDGLVSAVKAMRAQAFGISGGRDLTDDKHRASRREGRKNDDRKGGKNKTPTWGAPPPGDSSPIEIPLPVGNAYLGGGAGVGAAGVEIGYKQGSSTPVCIAGVEPGSLGCGTQPKQKVRVRGGASGEVNGQEVGAEVDEEVDTDVA
jgi:hypothetical protein